VAQLLADENFPYPAVEALRHLGHDVVTLAELGQAHQAVPDTVVLDLAIAAGRAIVTLNRRHFIRLHGRKPDHAGIVICSFDRDFEAQARRIDETVRGLAGLDGVLLRIARASSTD
jgi:hypothetical protein